VEAGHRIPRLPAVAALARALGLSAGWLAFGLESPPGAEPDAAGLGKRARQVRDAQGLSARAVGRAAVLREGTVRAIEAGGMPTLDTLEQLAVLLGVSPAWLAYGLGPMEPPHRQSRPSASATP